MRKTLIFAYGTLKRTYFNHNYLSNAIYLGKYRTVDKYPLILSSPRNSPCILDIKGVGHHINGELYQITPAELIIIDKLEKNYYKKLIYVTAEKDTKIAFIYVKHVVEAKLKNATLYSDYTDRTYRSDEQC